MPGNARWQKQDSIGALAGFNMYAYAGNPVSFSDPLGLFLSSAACPVGLERAGEDLNDWVTANLTGLWDDPRNAADNILIILGNIGDIINYGFPPDPEVPMSKLKRLTRDDADLLKRNGYDVHNLKKEILGGKADGSRFDLFRDKRGNIFIGPKSGSGTGTSCGLQIRR